MNKRRVKHIGTALVLAAAAGFYLDRGPRAPPTSLGTAGEADVLKLREPRRLPELALTDANGNTTQLSSFRGKVVLLNIWATWCAPCRKEMPALDRLQARLGGPAFEVVALSVEGNDISAAKAFYLRTGIRHLGIYLDDSGQALSSLGVSGIPTTILIDRNGHEVGRTVGPAEWDSPAIVTEISRHLDMPVKLSVISGDSALWHRSSVSTK